VRVGTDASTANRWRSLAAWLMMLAA
jgi:hypothetical protein